MKRAVLSIMLGIALFGALGFGSHLAYSQQTSEKPLAKQTYPLNLSLIPGTQLKQGEILIARLEEDDLGPGTHRIGRYNVDFVARLDNQKAKFFEAPVDAEGWKASRSQRLAYEAVLGIPVDITPGEHSLVVSTASGEEIARQSFKILDGRFRRQNISVSKGTKGLQPLPGELEAIQALKNNSTEIRYWKKPFMSPTQDCENSPFGVKRYHNGVYIHDYHKGVDLRSPQGRPIRAIADGVVKISEPKFRLHGGTVGLDHGHGLNSVYIHMSRVAVKAGDKVKKGDVVGNVGSTGFATGPHLHWGLFVNGVPVNPDVWIPVPHC